MKVNWKPTPACFPTSLLPSTVLPLMKLPAPLQLFELTDKLFGFSSDRAECVFFFFFFLYTCVLAVCSASGSRRRIFLIAQLLSSDAFKEHRLLCKVHSTCCHLGETQLQLKRQVYSLKPWKSLLQMKNTKLIRVNGREGHFSFVNILHVFCGPVQFPALPLTYRLFSALPNKTPATNSFISQHCFECAHLCTGDI